jgi:predicted transposase YdaD
MVPLQQLRDSSVYQFIKNEGLEEGREEGIEEGRKAIVEILLYSIERKFPGFVWPGFNLKSELERVENLDPLKRFYFDFDQIADADTLRARLNDFAIENRTENQPTVKH